MDDPTQPFWRKDTPAAGASPLTADEAADVCIVGAGMAGLSTAYLLAREGSLVIVVDAGTTAGGETARTTAHLVNVLDRGYSEIERLRGRDGLRLAIESHSQAIDEIEAIVDRERLACDFARVDGYLVGDAQALDRELEAARGAGLAGVEPVDDAGFPGVRARALRFPRQASFHPLRYLAGVANAIEGSGGRIFGSTAVRAVHAGSDLLCIDTARGFSISAKHVVVATNSPIHGSLAIHTKQAAYRTYVIAAPVERGQFPPALVWDTATPFHYVRTARSSDAEMLLVGGEDHKTGQDEHPNERFASLERWASERWPSLRWEMRWSGQVMETVDGLALIGRDSSAANVWIATGDSGNGMTHGTLAGLILRDAILGRPNSWSELYALNRFPPRAVLRWASENLNVAAQLPRYFAPGEDPSDGPAPGKGAIVRRGIRPIAVYRDAAGVRHERSAICPHLGCVVAWNEVESSWDCPCHGSRFDALGHVIAGPAARDLARVAGDDSASAKRPEDVAENARKSASRRKTARSRAGRSLN